MKRLFSFYLDQDLKFQAQTRADAENRSLASLIEVALRYYLDPESLGSRVTVKTAEKSSRGLSSLLKPSPGANYTARIIAIDQERGVIVLERPDPETGRQEFAYNEIMSIHLK